MKKGQPLTEPTIVAEAERRMQAWVRTAEIEDRALRTQTAEQIARSIKPFLAISREAGAGGGEIARPWARNSAGRCSTKTSWISSPSGFIFRVPCSNMSTKPPAIGFTT